jgi:hypothetical protein
MRILKDKRGDLEWVIKIFIYVVFFALAITGLYFLFKRLL